METDFYARWAISRNMLWRILLRQFSRLGWSGARLRPLPSGPRRLAVLGAGPCRDLPMDFLCAAFDEVVLVDKDADALAASRIYIPEDAGEKVKRVPWDVNGRLAGHINTLLDAVREGKLDIRGAASAAGRNVPTWTPEDLPLELVSRMPFSFVISDLLMTQLAMNYAFELSLALGVSLRELYSIRKPELEALSLATGRNHLELLRLLAQPGGSVVVLNDTFMLGRDFDGSESAFNQIDADRGSLGAKDSSWIFADDIDAWMPEYSLLGSDLAAVLKLTGALHGMDITERTWWWWPHCHRKSYLVVGSILTEPGPR